MWKHGCLQVRLQIDSDQIGDATIGVECNVICYWRVEYRLRPSVWYMSFQVTLLLQAKNQHYVTQITGILLPN